MNAIAARTRLAMKVISEREIAAAAMPAVDARLSAADRVVVVQPMARSSGTMAKLAISPIFESASSAALVIWPDSKCLMRTSTAKVWNSVSMIPSGTARARSKPKVRRVVARASAMR